MILHLAHIENAKIAALVECLKYTSAKDMIIILYEGCNTQLREHMQSLCGARNIPVQFLEATANTENKEDPFSTISYSAFVDLCCSCDKVQSWY